MLIWRGTFCWKPPPESDLNGSKVMSNWRILKTIENKRNPFLFLAVSHHQFSSFQTDSSRSEHNGILNRIKVPFCDPSLLYLYGIVQKMCTKTKQAFFSLIFSQSLCYICEFLTNLLYHSFVHTSLWTNFLHYVHKGLYWSKRITTFWGKMREGLRLWIMKWTCNRVHDK